jgi:hypothetical protein
MSVHRASFEAGPKERSNGLLAEVPDGTDAIDFVEMLRPVIFSRRKP